MTAIEIHDWGARIRKLKSSIRRLFGKSYTRRKIPFVAQITTADCGAACLSMVLRWNDMHVGLTSIREMLVDSAHGTSALSLIKVAERFNLRGRGVSLGEDDYEYLEPGSILHWEMDHFVVLEKIDGKYFYILDPAGGRLRLNKGEFSGRFTGIALLFEPTETTRPIKGDPAPVWNYFRRVLSYSPLLIRVVAMSAIIQILGLGLPILTGMLVDKVIPQHNISLMKVLALGLGILVIFHFLAAFIRSHVLLYLRTTIDIGMTKRFLEHLFDLPFRYFQSRTAGDLMLRLKSNTMVREIITSSALSGALDGFSVLSYLVVLLVLSPVLGAVVLFLGFLRIVIFLCFKNRIRELMAENLVKQAKISGYEVQMFTGMLTLKSAGAEPIALQHWTRLYVDVLNVAIAQGRLDALAQALITALGTASPIIILIVGGALVLDGQMTLGHMLAMSALANGFLFPLTSLVGAALQFQQLGGYVERLNDIMSLPKEQDRTKVETAPVLSGRIELENVTFSYGPSPYPTVEDVSLTIEPGQMVAIVGRSGAGKTTLGKLILGLYLPDSGSVLIDNKDINNYESRSLRSQFGVVVQHPHLFGASIHDNIALVDPELSTEKVVSAARLAHIHDDIMAMPLGYNTMLGDADSSLSGGQMQRIALARALVKDPAFLLLDEATSELDADTEKRIQKSLSGLGCSRIVIANRLSTIQDADAIFVMDQGMLVEQGTHHELLAMGGAYAHFVNGKV